MRKLLAAAVLAASACAGPTTIVRTVDTRPAIAVAGAPASGVLYVDGLEVGRADDYDGHPNVLRVEAGTHDLEIRQDGRVVFSRRVFVESELKTVEVH